MFVLVFSERLLVVSEYYETTLLSQLTSGKYSRSVDNTIVNTLVIVQLIALRDLS